MYIVDSIRLLNKKRYRIVLDNGEVFPLYGVEISRFDIREGETLPDIAYNEIICEILPKRAKMRSLNLLKDRPYTCYQMTKKLEEGFYPNQIIYDTIDYLKELRLIDDRSYCKNYIEYYSSTKSLKKIEMDLRTKGVASDMVLEVLEEITSEESITNESEVIRKILHKKKFSVENSSFEEKMKMKKYLYGKGFSADSINTFF